MRLLLFYSILSGFFIASGNAQNSASPKDERIYYSNHIIQVPSEIGLKFIVKEKYARSFAENPLLFLENNFSMEAYLKYSKKKEYHGYKVSIKSNKVHLVAEFDRNGKLLYNFRREENKILPFAVQKNITENYKNWRIIKNSYIASGKQNKIDDEVYIIKLNKEKESKIVEIIPDRNSTQAIVKN